MAMLAVSSLEVRNGQDGKVQHCIVGLSLSAAGGRPRSHFSADSWREANMS
jgi:hypothetical protein